MDMLVYPRPLSGELRSIPSKSQAHRLLICAALADGPSELLIPSFSEDTEATVRCLEALGARFERKGDAVSVTPIDRASLPASPLLDCGESGSTLRFMLPVAASLCEKARFTGRGRLPERPNGPLIEAMKAHGSRFSSETLPFEVTKMSSGGRFAVPGNISSQYITGLLLAAPLLPGGAEIEFTAPLESRGYVDMTVEALEAFGVQVRLDENGCAVAPGARLLARDDLAVGGDWSNAAFWLVAGATGSRISVSGLDPNSRQGDRAVFDILRRMGASVTEESGRITAESSRLHAVEIDAADIPDLVPVLSVAAACAEGTTRFYNTSRLRLKESDRLETTAAMLSALGSGAEISGDELFVTGAPSLAGGTVNSANDHRIAMAAAAASCACRAPVKILGAECTAKSYPDFFKDLISLGGRAESV